MYLNNYVKYRGQLAGDLAADPIGTQKYIQEEREKAYKSYPDGAEVVYCAICGEPLRYRSVSYTEGWHIDSCL